MPGSYSYWRGLDCNKFIQMESPRKNNDCYFYYYSKCTKGDNCTFRHEPTALGCETVCSFWQQGKCLNQHCNLRHMELRKNRKAIPCYWESQPGGCLKPHCSFQHKAAKEQSALEHEHRTGAPSKGPDRPDWNRRPGNHQYDPMKQEGNECTMPPNMRRVSQTSDSNPNYASSTVDALVVNFEEESDNESVPTTSPSKHSHQQQQQRIVRVKTLEEIRLERIQAESAAFYSYSKEEEKDFAAANDLRNRIMDRIHQRKITNVDFKILTLDEIRKQKRAHSPDVAAIDVPTCKKEKIADMMISSSSGGSGESEVLVSSSSTAIVLPLRRKSKRKLSENGVRSKLKIIRPLLEEKEEGEEEKEAVTERLLLSPVPVPTQTEIIVNKISEESLLLMDDDCSDNVSLSAADDILQNIDDILND